MMECPECTAGLEWKGGTDITPEAVLSAYLCPNPDCGISLLEVVAEE